MAENLNSKMNVKFDDPLAGVTEWTMISWAGHRFQDYAGVQTSPTRYEYKITRNLYRYLFRLPVFLGITGIFLFIVSLPGGFNFILAFMFLGFLPLSGIGTAYWYHKQLSKAIVFDTQVCYFWKGNITPGSAEDINKIKICLKIEDIYALQILYQNYRPYLKSFQCYELNLVLKDGSRQILLNHGDLIKMREDASALAEFLELPVWDKTK